MENSKIQWTDHTFNPWRGCTKVSAGCANCYAESMSGINPKVLGQWGPNGTRVVASEAKWVEPLKWNRQAQQALIDASDHNHRFCGDAGFVEEVAERPRVFCASLGDVFESWNGPMKDSKERYLAKRGDAFVPSELKIGRDIVTMAHARFRLLDLIRRTPHLDWLLLTKRPENFGLAMSCIRTVFDANHDETLIWAANWAAGIDVPSNVWIGTSVENQKAADERIPHLLKIPAAVRFLSCEPLLGPVDLSRWLLIKWQCSGCRGYFSGQWLKVCPDCGKQDQWSGSHAFNGRGLPARQIFPRQEGNGIDWVIVGGESGADARQFQIGWASDIVRQCKIASVAPFVKQLGENASTRLLTNEQWPGHTGPDSPVQFSGDGFGNYTVLGLKDKKGGDITEWPEDLKVREFPIAKGA
ncbi:DUF5131 family protein [Zavarzinella formosa]|uniref:DUF5131 family protein n=1 Tax=Zavarzinella formosa TaxID=360055 RepID=UPI00030F163D|nr:DUF5131 family protein [Zavarzinella formosa]